MTLDEIKTKLKPGDKVKNTFIRTKNDILTFIEITADNPYNQTVIVGSNKQLDAGPSSITPRDKLKNKHFNFQFYYEYLSDYISCKIDESDQDEIILI